MTTGMNLNGGGCFDAHLTTVQDYPAGTGGVVRAAPQNLRRQRGDAAKVAIARIVWHDS